VATINNQNLLKLWGQANYKLEASLSPKFICIVYENLKSSLLFYDGNELAKASNYIIKYYFLS